MSCFKRSYQQNSLTKSALRTWNCSLGSRPDLYSSDISLLSKNKHKGWLAMEVSANKWSRIMFYRGLQTLWNKSIYLDFVKLELQISLLFCIYIVLNCKSLILFWCWSDGKISFYIFSIIDDRVLNLYKYNFTK